MCNIEHAPGFHQAGSKGSAFIQWNQQNKLAATQKLAKQSKQHAQCDAELIALHEEANTVYKKNQRNEQTHYSRLSQDRYCST